MVNAKLSIGAAVTFKGDEVKCYTPAAQGSDVDKTYLSADDCADLSSAFASLSLSLAEPSGCKESG